MKDHSTMSTTDFLWSIAWKYALGFVLYKALLFRVIPHWNIHDSLTLLWGMELSLVLFSIVVLRLWKTGWASNAYALLPFGVYTVLVYSKSFRIFAVIAVCAAVLVTMAYSATVFIRKISTSQPNIRRKIIRNRFLRCLYAFSCITATALLLFMLSICWNKYFNTGLVSASVEAKSADAGERNRDTIGANMGSVLKLQPQIWEELTTRDRLDVLQTVCNIEVCYLGITDPVTVQADNLPENTLGTYRDDLRLVLVNLDHIENDLVDEVLDTVLHEVYHCYEHRVAEVFEITETEYRNLRLFYDASQYSKEIGNYISPKEDYSGYIEQSMELDSSIYAALRAQEYDRCIQRWLEETASDTQQ